MPHRPLSKWISLVSLSSGFARWDSTGLVNYGNERADARTFPGFGDGWRRRAVPLDLGYKALGLVREDSDETVVELDSFAMPIRVTESGAEVIAWIETVWPTVILSSTDLAVLAAEEVVVRHLLLTRLAAEGHPQHALFHILPWDLVDRLADQMTAVLHGAEPQQVTALQEWFVPVGSHFTEALEQLDEGLRRSDGELVRIAETALYARLLEVDVSRIPEATRQALARLVDALLQRDDLLSYAARRTIERLTDATGADA